MTLTEITSLANNFTDESATTTVAMAYANSALSSINVALKSTLPPITVAATEYVALHTDWMQLVVVPYVCWAIKMNDGSLNEAREYLYMFESGLKKLKTNKRTAIDTVYQGTGFASKYAITGYSNM